MAGGPHDSVNILLVDDHPAKLMAYEVILQDLGERLIKATSGKEALEQLLKHDIAVVLVDVCMPDLDGRASRIPTNESTYDQGGLRRLQIVGRAARDERPAAR